jgi:RNA-directed DNA polymerase
MPGFYLPSENEYDCDTDDFLLPCLAKERKYRHFDFPLKDNARKLDIDFSNEATPHRFFPLLGFTEVVRKFVRNKSGDRNRKVKERPIRYASHRDAAYLQNYAVYLNSFYERALLSDGIADSVLAYRRGGHTNIHHAKSLFSEIKQKGNCVVIAMDISGFFDSLDHLHLRDAIASILSIEKLQGHHVTIWKNITRFAWVETADLDSVLGKKRIRSGRICSQNDFVTHVRGKSAGLVNTNDGQCGIPQGTPVSGLFANVYMRTFDKEMIDFCSQYGGTYRRYSDDIALVLPSIVKTKHVISLVEKILADFKLTISIDKTETAEFRDGLLVSDKPIQYLGFVFDGNRTFIRPSSLDAYRSKMRRGIHAKVVAAKMKKVNPSEIYLRESLSRYTHLGKRRNFLRYAYKASEIMNSPEIRSQVNRHITWFKRVWKKEVQTVYGLPIK